MNFLAIEENFIERKHYLLFLLFFIASFALSVLLPISKVFLLIAGFSLVVAIFKIPEIGFSIFLLIGVIKEITEGFPIDFTLLIFFLTLLAIAYKLLSRKYKINFSNKYVFFYFIFIFILLISNLYTLSPSSGLEKSIRFLVFNTFLFIGGISLGYNKHCRIRVLKILHTMIFIYSLVYLYYLKDMIGMNFQELAKYHMRLSLVGNPISVGRIFSLLVLLSLISLHYTKNTLMRVYHILCVLLGLLVTLSTNSRGPLFALIISIVLYLVLFSGIDKKKVLMMILFFIILFMMAFSLLPETFVSRYELVGEKEVHISEESIRVFSTSKIRERYINKSLQFLSNNEDKIIYGIGVGGFSYLLANKQDRLYPHNIIMEIMIELGIIGLMLFLFPFLFILSDFFKIREKIDKKNYREIIFWVMLTIIFLLNAQVSGDINDNRLLWFFQGGLAGCLLFFKKKKV